MAVNFTPWLMLNHTASPATILTNGISALTSSFVTNSAGTAISTGNIFLLIGLPISFGNAKLGALSGALSTIQAAGNATATFTAGATGGVASADATVDATPVTALITVQQAPSFTFCQPNIISNNAAGQCSAIVTYSASATGYPPVIVTFSTASGSLFPKGTATITATATNGILPNATCIFTVTVVDAESPIIISCPANVIANEDPLGSGSAVVKFLTPGAFDNCSGVGAVLSTPASGSTFLVGTNIVTNTVADLAGNIATCKFSVIVQPATNAAFRIVSVQPQTNDLLVIWATPGGRTNMLQATTGGPGGSYTDNFTDVLGATQFVIAPLGDTVTNFLINGGATSTPAHYYRVRGTK